LEIEIRSRNGVGAKRRHSALFAGSVGIGTTTPQTRLDVAGAIKIGSQTTCDVNTTGAIRYNSVAKVFEGCDGVSWKRISECPSSVTFTYKGSSVTYGTVESLGKCWMDRNLGASRVATAFDDSAAYGDLFQWGRLDDGHQARTSGTTATLSSTDDPGHGNFILTSASPNDWRSPQNDNLWQGVSGINNPCPSGWRLPTKTEWDTERLTWSPNSYVGAYASPLKLTAGGYRSFAAGAPLLGAGTSGYYWSATVADTYSWKLGTGGSWTETGANTRAFGFAVRCVQD
jgi:uncharacterized protein (TIGR02145 family)